MQRRDFLKISAAGATGLTLARANRAFAAWPSSGTLTINPDISNTLVVACYDTAMMKSTPTSTAFPNVDTAVDTARVAANMDAMAMRLASETSADAAWKKIFRSSKAWASTVVAIKVNAVESRNMARMAVIQKFCSVLASLGVPPANIFVYDGNTTYSKAMSNYDAYFSLTDPSKIGAVVSGGNSSLGGTSNAKLPDGSSAACAADVASGKVDILINLANNKGHTLFGGSTLCMKNHFGTFVPLSTADHNNLSKMTSYIFNINKSDAIVGGSPVRQQLCFVDSLLANKANNSGQPEAMPCYLIMGTCAPVVDYLTVKKVREAVMNATHDSATVNSFLTSFGYTTADPEWVLVPPATSSADAGIAGSAGSGGAGRGGASGTARGGAGGTGRGGAAGGGFDAGSDARGGSNSAGAGGGGGAAAGSGGGADANGGSGRGGATLAGTGGAGGGATGGSGGEPHGGSAGSGGSSGGTTSASGLGGAGGSVANGGTGGAQATSDATSGCACDLGKPRSRPSRWEALLVVGAAVAGRAAGLGKGKSE